MSQEDYKTLCEKQEDIIKRLTKQLEELNELIDDDNKVSLMTEIEKLDPFYEHGEGHSLFLTYNTDWLVVMEEELKKKFYEKILKIRTYNKLIDEMFFNSTTTLK